MSAEIFKLMSVASSEGGIGFVNITLMREAGNQFDVCLSADDAERLIEDLRPQIAAARMPKRR